MDSIKENITDLETLRNDIVIKQKKTYHLSVLRLFYGY